MTHTAPKPLRHAAEPCSSAEFEQAMAGHTAHFVSDRVTLLLARWSPISPRDYWIWSQLMVRTREYKTLELRISHRTLYTDAGVSEATMRDALVRLSLMGFIDMKHKTFTRFGKNYVLRVTFPRHLIRELNAELNRCRLKQTPPPITVGDQVCDIDTIKVATPPVSDNPTRDEHDHAHSQSGITHLSWEGKPLADQDAYLPVPEQPHLHAPYQPRQDRRDEWVPSVSELALSLDPALQPPQTIAEQRRLIDIMDWASGLQLTFLQQAFQSSKSTRSFGWFLLNSPGIDTLFSDHLRARLPHETQELVPILMERLKAYKAPYANKWFPLTEGMLQQQQQSYQAAIEQQALATRTLKPSLSPAVALSVPTPWFHRVLMTVKTLKLPRSKVLEIAYHVLNFTPSKTFDAVDERRKFNLCLAIRLIKDARWACPSGLGQPT